MTKNDDPIYYGWTREPSGMTIIEWISVVVVVSLGVGFLIWG